MKRLAVLFMAMTLLLSGCGVKQAGNESGDKYQIDWFFVGNPMPDVQLVETEVNKYLEGKLPVTVKLNALDWGSVRQKLNTMIAGGEKFDICYTDTESYQSQAAKGAFVPLNELMDKYAPKTKEMLGEDFLKGSQIDGVNYAIPANKDKGHSWGIIFRKDIADKYNLTDKIKAAKTFDDLNPILDFIKEKEPDLIPLKESKDKCMSSLIDFDEISFPGAFYANGNDGVVVNMIETPEFMEACKKTREHYLNGYLNEGGSIGTSSDAKAFMSIVMLKPGKAKETQVAKGMEYDQVELTEARMSVKDTMGAMMAISRTSEQPELVMQFMELFNTDEYLNNLIVFGIEGKHYNKVSDKTIELIQDSGYGYPDMRWEFGNTFLQYLTTAEDSNKHETMQMFNNSLKTSQYLGFNFNPESVKTEIGACLNVKEQFNQRCAEGMEDPEELVPMYIDKLKRAGSDKIIQEIQRQYDEWKSNKS
ncbi:MAG: ABC transporter substrate-binding protein [Monoglobaceae bacterium]